MAGDAPGTAHDDQASTGVPAAAAPSRLALYRRYRPATFAEVKGQEHVTEPLRQALRNGRVHHAYLFSGPRGCGKTSSARILARSLNCVQGPTPDPCGVCESCVALAPSGPGSIDVIEIDAASHGGVDDARDLRERAFYAPVSGRFKVYIIDEAHMVTREGFNALLKLVEEPPPHLKFVFATTEPEKVIATIKSRTHHYPFRLVPPGVLRELLEEILAAEGVRYEPSVIPLVVRAGAGSVRDALSVLDQLIAGAGEEGLGYDRTVSLLGYSDDSLLDDMVAAFAAGDGAAAFGTVDRMVQSGHDPRRFAADLLDRMRDLIILAAVPGAGEAGLLDAPADRLDRMAEQAERFGQAELARAAEILSDGLIQMRGTASPRLLLELICAQVLLPGAGIGEKALLVRLERLEHLLAGRTGEEPGAGSRGGGASRPQSRHAEPVRTDHAPARRPQGPQPQQVAQDAGSLPATRQPPRTQPAQHSTPPAAQPPPPSRAAQQPTPSPGGELDVEALRQRWPDVMRAVAADRKVAWIQLQSAVVESLDNGVLTLGFSSEGVAKGFSSRGNDEVLAGVLASLLGLNARVKASVAVGHAAGTTGQPVTRAAGPAQAPAAARSEPAGPAPRAGHHGPAAGEDGPGAAAGGDGPEPAAGGDGPGPAVKPGDHRRAAKPGERRRAEKPGEEMRTEKPGARRPATGTGGPESAVGPRAAAGTPAPPEPPGDAGAGSMTGMELIQRQLGGRIIQEIEEA